MNDPRLPLPEPSDDDDLPDVFAGLTGIDVVDGELIPRASEPPQPDLPAAS